MIIAFYSGILAIIYLFLSANVIKGRYANKISLGDGESDDMVRRIRTHANFAEYVPFALFLLFLLEREDFSTIGLHLLAIALILGRILHPLGIKTAESPGVYRRAGMVLTFGVMAIAALCNILLFIF